MYPSIMFSVAITVTAFMLKVKVSTNICRNVFRNGLELPAATATIMVLVIF